MPKDAEVTRITEERGKDGSSVYVVEGGKPGEGAVDFRVTKEVWDDSTKKGSAAHQEQLKKWVEMKLQHDKENR